MFGINKKKNTTKEIKEKDLEYDLVPNLIKNYVDKEEAKAIWRVLTCDNVSYYKENTPQFIQATWNLYMKNIGDECYKKYHINGTDLLPIAGKKMGDCVREYPHAFALNRFTVDLSEKALKLIERFREKNNYNGDTSELIVQMLEDSK